jgi:sugar phosphate isomerase/epimerase
MKISMGSWAFSFGPYAAHPAPFENVVERLSEAGYDGIEICGFPPHVTPGRYAGAEARAGLSRLLRDHGLAVSGYAADLTAVNPVTEGNKQKYLDLFQRNVELCAAIGSPAIRVDSGAAPGSIPDREYGAATGRLAEVWREAAAIAQTHAVRVVWEFEPGFEFNKPSEVAALTDLVGHPNFKVLFDTAHAYMCGVAGARQHGTPETLPGGVAEFIRRLGGRIGHVHIDNSDGTLYGEETSTHRPMSQGVIDLTAVAPRLLALPGIEWWCLDLCFCAEAWDLVKPSLDYARALLSASRVAV